MKEHMNIEINNETIFKTGLFIWSGNGGPHHFPKKRLFYHPIKYLYPSEILPKSGQNAIKTSTPLRLKNLAHLNPPASETFQ